MSRRGKYHQMYLTEYFDYAKKYLQLDGYSGSSSNTETTVTDTFYLERKCPEVDFLEWFKSEEKLEHAKKRIVELLVNADRKHSNLQLDIKYYCRDLDYFQKFLIERTQKEFNIVEMYDEQVQEIAIKLLEHIISENEIIAYGELTKKLSFPMNPRNIERQLGVISFACKDNGLPPISVMVVNKDTLMPGESFFKAYYPDMKSNDERWKKCFELMKQVKSYKEWNKALDAFKNWH